jgi:hypothetical protein
MSEKNLYAVLAITSDELCSLSKCKVEAERFASKHPGATFTVVKAVESVRTVSPLHWTKIEGEE